MKELWINQYVSKITIEQIQMFARENNIVLNEAEADMINNIIKKEWKTLLYGNPNPIFSFLHSQLGEERTRHIVSLYEEYKEKYKNYL